MTPLVAMIAVCVAGLVVATGAAGDGGDKALSDCRGVMDAHGHGPDPGSDEWWTSCHFQLLKGVWLRRLPDGRGVTGYQFGPQGRLDPVNQDTAAGARWQLAGRTSLDLLSKQHRATWRIVKISRDELVLAAQDPSPGPVDRLLRPPRRQPADAWIGRWHAGDAGFLDLTPAVGDDGTWSAGYRLAVGRDGAVTRFDAAADADRLRFVEAGRPRHLRRVAAPDDGTPSWLRVECLQLDDADRYCRTVWSD